MSKSELVKHYIDGFEGRKAGRFVQWGGWCTGKPGDPCEYNEGPQPDQDGDLVTYSACEELIGKSEWAVRLYIRAGTKQKDVARLVQKIAVWVEQDSRVGLLDRTQEDDDLPW